MSDMDQYLIAAIWVLITLAVMILPVLALWWYIGPFRHRHTWGIIKLQHFEIGWWDRKWNTKVETGETTTEVYEKCACGETRRRVLKGTWTLEDLK